MESDSIKTKDFKGITEGINKKSKTLKVPETQETVSLGREDVGGDYVQ